MGKDESTDWPVGDNDPFGDVEPENNPPLEMEDIGLEKPEEETKEEAEAEVESETNPESSEGGSEWSLPIRAAPLLSQFHNETVTEYPLQQSSDGRKATSLVVDQDLLRIIDSRLDDDGQRRLKVTLSMKGEITGFKHQHNELMHKHQLLWLGFFISGLVLLLLPPVIFNFIGVILVALGVWYWSAMHLETHHLEFSNSGGTLSHTLHGYGTNRPFFRASMALLGSEMAGLLRNGTLETETLDQLHASLAAPAPAPAPAQTPLPIPVQPSQDHFEAQPSPSLLQHVVATPTSIPPPPTSPPPPVQFTPVEEAPMAGPPVASSLPMPLPLPPTAAPMPLPPPPTSAPTPLPPPPTSAPTPLPLPPVSTAKPLPPLPDPLPPLGAPAGMPLPAPFGLPAAPLSLDAPLPNAPKIAVMASPVEDTLSEKEQNELLNELS